MGLDTIIALDLGKLNSVACILEAATRRHTFQTLATPPQTLVDVEACDAAGWGYARTRGAAHTWLKAYSTYAKMLIAQMTGAATPMFANRRSRCGTPIGRRARATHAKAKAPPSTMASARSPRSSFVGSGKPLAAPRTARPIAAGPLQRPQTKAGTASDFTRASG